MANEKEEEINWVIEFDYIGTKRELRDLLDTLALDETRITTNERRVFCKPRFFL